MNPELHVEALRPVAGRTRPEEARTPMVFALLAVAITLSVSGELMLKMGMNRYAATFGALDLSPATLLPTLFRVFTQPLVFLGFVFVFSASIFWLAVLSRVNLSFAYPILALGYVLTAIFSYFLFSEAISPTRWAGIIIICVGVVLVSRS